MGREHGIAGNDLSRDFRRPCFFWLSLNRGPCKTTRDGWIFSLAQPLDPPGDPQTPGASVLITIPVAGEYPSDICNPPEGLSGCRHFHFFARLYEHRCRTRPNIPKRLIVVERQLTV